MTPRGRLLRAAGFVAAAAGLAEIARQVLATRPLAGEALAAFAADLVAGRALAISWYGEKGSAKTALHAALVTAAAALGALAVGLAVGKARVAGTALGWDTLPLGAINAIAVAVRIEVPCRVLPLALGEGLVPKPALYAFAVVAGVAPTLAELPLRPGAIAVAAAIGVLSVALIVKTRAAIAGVAAHAALLFATGPLLTSTIDVRWASGSLTPLDRADGIAAWLVAAACVGAAVIVTRWAPREA